MIPQPYWLIRWRLKHAPKTCGAVVGARNHGGLVNPCVRRLGHAGKHRDMWATKF